MVPENPNPLRPLTAKEKLVLEFIENYLLQEGIAPSYQEIKDHFGFASFNSVQRYLKQLQSKEYIHIPGGNQKRAITILHSSQAALESLNKTLSHPSLNNVVSANPFAAPSSQEEASMNLSTSISSESLSLPLYGKVAAGRPIEAIEYNEFVDVPPSMVKYPARSFALKVEGSSMIEDAILDGDIILVQEQQQANNGDIVVAVVDNEATVKRFYSYKSENDFFNKSTQSYTHFSQYPVIELRPSNSSMESLWFSPEEVKISGLVVGLLRQF